MTDDAEFTFSTAEAGQTVGIHTLLPTSNMDSDAMNVGHVAQKFCILSMILYSCSCK